MAVKEGRKQKRGVKILKKLLTALVAVLFLGTFGYMTIEKMTFAESLLSTVSVMATVSAPQNLSTQGKIFTVALIIAAVGILVTAVAKFFNPPVEQEEELLTGFFSSMPEAEHLIMKEVSVNGKSPLAGLQKAQILQKYGVVVVGVKRKSGFDIDAPLNMKVKAGSSILILGEPSAIIGVEKKRR